MQPTLSLEVSNTVRLPDEPTEIILLIGNSGNEPLQTDVPADSWWTRCRLTLRSPDGSEMRIFPFQVETSKPTADKNLTISAGAELEKTFTLEGLANVNTIGQYTLGGIFVTPSQKIEILPVNWFVEGSRRIELSLPACHGINELHESGCWVLFRGEQIGCLLFRRLVKNDISSSLPMGISFPERMQETDINAYGMVAMESMVPQPSAKEQWVAWLSGNTLQAGVALVIFNTVSFALPGAPKRILPNLLPAANGGTEAFILREDGRQLWVVRIDGPVLREESVVEPSQGAEGGKSRPSHPDESAAVMEKTFADGDPRTLVLMPTPELGDPIELPRQCFQGAAARDFQADESTAGILFSAQNGKDIGLYYAVVKKGRLSTKWHQVVIPDAQLLPDADPALVFDNSRIARAAVLFQAGFTEEDPGRLGIAYLAFGPDGQNLYVEGIGRRDLLSLTRQPVSAGMAWFMDCETGERRCDWSVVFPDNTCLICRGNNTPEHLKPFEEILLPPKLFPALEYTALATRRPEGALDFACID